ncbi:MAG: helix-turn-helix transcriptional regulator [Clostridia bacterium]|nr:helix-turn-helix transcriptional regulator [Clostridia bacterium]
MAIIYGMPERLREAVNESGLKHVEISRRAGISYSRFEALLAGDGGCYISTFAKLCAVLNVSSDWLLGLKKGRD